jgi:hypothetical protein
VHRHAGAFPGGVEAGRHRAGGVEDHLGGRVGGYPAHGVVGRRLHGDQVGLGLDAEVGADEVGDVGELGVDLLRGQVGEVEVDEVTACSAPSALTDLGEHRPAHHVAGGKVLHCRRITLHKRLAIAVAEDAALAPCRLGQQDPELVDAGRVELEELHVLERHPAAEEQAGPVPGEGVGVGRDLEHLAEAAGREEGGLALEDVEVTGRELIGDHARQRRVGAGSAVVAGEGHVEHDELREEVDVAGHALLVQGLQDHVARAVGRVTGPPHRGFPVVAGVATEAALVDAAVGRAVEGQAQVLELDDGVDRLAAHDFGRRLVDQVVAALHRVEGVPLPGVVLHVGQRRAHAPLGGAGVGTGGVQLGQDGRPAAPGRLDGRSQPGPARAHDDGVEAVPVDLHVRP